jgi:hypothetical protein
MESGPWTLRLFPVLKHTGSLRDLSRRFVETEERVIHRVLMTRFNLALHCPLLAHAQDTVHPISGVRASYVSHDGSSIDLDGNSLDPWREHGTQVRDSRP